MERQQFLQMWVNTLVAYNVPYRQWGTFLMGIAVINMAAPTTKLYIIPLQNGEE